MGGLVDARKKLTEIFRILIGESVEEWRCQKRQTILVSDRDWAEHLLAVHKRCCPGDGCRLPTQFHKPADAALTRQQPIVFTDEPIVQPERTPFPVHQPSCTVTTATATNHEELSIPRKSVASHHTSVKRISEDSLPQSKHVKKSSLSTVSRPLLKSSLPTLPSPHSEAINNTVAVKIEVGSDTNAQSNGFNVDTEIPELGWSDNQNCNTYDNIEGQMGGDVSICKQEVTADESSFIYPDNDTFVEDRIENHYIPKTSTCDTAAHNDFDVAEASQESVYRVDGPHNSSVDAEGASNQIMYEVDNSEIYDDDITDASHQECVENPENYQVIENIGGTFRTRRRRKRRRRTVPIDMRLEPDGVHYPKKLAVGKRLNCVVCSNKYKRKRTGYICGCCEVALCIYIKSYDPHAVSCFELYHN